MCANGNAAFVAAVRMVAPLFAGSLIRPDVVLTAGEGWCSLLPAKPLPALPLHLSPCHQLLYLPAHSALLLVSARLGSFLRQCCVPGGRHAVPAAALPAAHCVLSEGQLLEVASVTVGAANLHCPGSAPVRTSSAEVSGWPGARLPVKRLDWLWQACKQAGSERQRAALCWVRVRVSLIGDAGCWLGC